MSLWGFFFFFFFFFFGKKRECFFYSFGMDSLLFAARSRTFDVEKYNNTIIIFTISRITYPSGWIFVHTKRKR